MSLAEQTLTFAAQAPSLQNRKALGASLMSLIGTVGARNYACLYLLRERGELVIDRSISNLPRPFLERYLERGYDATDPVFQGAVRAGAAGFWSELVRAGSLNRAGEEVMGNARDFDMHEGFTRRVQLDQGGMAVMMVAGEDLIRSDRARAALSMSFDVFANVGARMLQLNERTEAEEDDSGEDLSKTQLKVLLMRAEGMSNRAVAAAMNRHEKTIECHVTQILRRLDARNMIDAIRIASRRKLIL
jgi:LuxR family transcriptional regulator, quorum-sensing system regulator BjaR1